MKYVFFSLAVGICSILTKKNTYCSSWKIREKWNAKKVTMNLLETTWNSLFFSEKVYRSRKKNVLFKLNFFLFVFNLSSTYVGYTTFFLTIFSFLEMKTEQSVVFGAHSYGYSFGTHFIVSEYGISCAIEIQKEFL